MSGDNSKPTGDELREALKLLARDLGVWRDDDDLVGALRGRLRALQIVWSINLDNGISVTRRSIVSNLDAHIERLVPRTEKKLIDDPVGKRRYLNAVDVAFNIAKPPEPPPKQDVGEPVKFKEMNLVERQKWMDGQRPEYYLPGSFSVGFKTSRRCADDAIDQIVEQLISGDYTPIALNGESGGDAQEDSIMPPVQKSAGPPLVINSEGASTVKDVESNSTASGEPDKNMLGPSTNSHSLKLKMAVILVIPVILVALAIIVLVSNRSGQSGSSDFPAWSAATTGPVSRPSNGELAYKGGWGPDRLLNTQNLPSTYPVFNSMLDNPDGDERNFVNIKEYSNKNSGGWKDRIRVMPGQEFLARVYVQNDSSTASVDEPTSWIQDARLSIGKTSEHGNEKAIWATLSAVNAKSVWDGASFVSNTPIEVMFDTENLVLYNSAHPARDGGLKVDPDAFSSDGTPIGYDQMDGVIKGGYQFATYITVKVTITSG